MIGFLLFLPVFTSAQKFPVVPLAHERVRTGVTIPEGAICNNSVPAYFAIGNHAMLDENGLKYLRMSESECTAMCTDNRDPNGRNILCASVTYDAETRTCQVHRANIEPSGIMPLNAAPGRTYFEKFCLPPQAPVTCGEAQFFRAQQSILVGFAVDISVQPSLAACAGECIKNPSYCKSAMYFYEQGECILNSASALDNPQVFISEPYDKVVYIENGCFLKGQKRDQDAAAVLEEEEEERVVEETQVDQDKIIDELLKAEFGQENTNKNTDSGKSEEFEEPPPVAFSERGFGQWGIWTLCDRKDGRRVRRRECIIPDLGCRGRKIQSQWCEDLDSQERSSALPTTTTTTTEATTTTQGTATNPNNEIIFSPAWGKWSEECQLFDESQPCVNGSRLGFQTRQCNGNPFQCRGPFFRYCFIDCEE